MKKQEAAAFLGWALGAVEIGERPRSLYDLDGDYAGAKAAFGQVLATEPGMATALKMRDQAELGEFLKMTGNEQLAEDGSHSHRFYPSLLDEVQGRPSHGHLPARRYGRLAIDKISQRAL